MIPRRGVSTSVVVVESSTGSRTSGRCVTILDPDGLSSIVFGLELLEFTSEADDAAGVGSALDATVCVVAIPTDAVLSEAGAGVFDIGTSNG